MLWQYIYVKLGLVNVLTSCFWSYNISHLQEMLFFSITLNIANGTFNIIRQCTHTSMFVICRLWFLRPLQDVSVLQQRLEAVSYFISPRNVELVTSLQDCLKNVKNVTVSSLELFICTYLNIQMHISCDQLISHDSLMFITIWYMAATVVQ